MNHPIAEYPYRATEIKSTSHGGARFFHVHRFPRVDTYLNGFSVIIYPMAEICTEKDLRFTIGNEKHNLNVTKLHQKIKRMSIKWRENAPQFFFLATKPANGVYVYENVEGLIKFFERDYIPGRLIGYLFKKNIKAWEVKSLG